MVNYFFSQISKMKLVCEQEVAGVRARSSWRVSKMKLVCEQDEAGVRARSSWHRKLFRNISLQKKKLLSRRHWTGNEVETSEALEVAGICTNKGRLSFEGAMLL